MAAEYGRDVEVWDNSSIVVRPTERDAYEYLDYCAVDYADLVGLASLQRNSELYHFERWCHCCGSYEHRQVSASAALWSLQSLWSLQLQPTQAPLWCLDYGEDSPS